MRFIIVKSGNSLGLSIAFISPLVKYTWYSTLGAVAIKSILNSRSIRSWITSIWRSPKKPVLKPKPSACEVSGSKTKAASFSLSFSKASFNSSYLFGSIGYIPQNTIEFILRYPGRGVLVSFSNVVMVSPTWTVWTSLMLAAIQPTSPTVK